MSPKEAKNIPPTIAKEDARAIAHIKQAVADGKHWYIALLEAIKLWKSTKEDYQGRHLLYLIDGEAFDWLLLAERLLEEVADAIPEQELINLLFFGKLPEQLSDETFMELIGPAKYHAYLNFLYGVVIERFVVLAVEEEIRKERHSHIFSRQDDGQNDSYMRVYGASQASLLKRFREERGYKNGEHMTLDRLQEFTYWLFKYRLENCDKARVASDTRKGVDYLRREYDRR